MYRPVLVLATFRLQRLSCEPAVNSKPVRILLLDIEGTTTPIAFVHDVLFLYARSRASDYLKAHRDSIETLECIAKLSEEHAADLRANGQPPSVIDGSEGFDTMVRYIQRLIDSDSKSTALKSLEGTIWSEGYKDGTLKGQVFPDVPGAFDRWRRANLKISIFSSGSKLAQKLLFSHTEAGDLSRYIDSYFDTSIGPKLSSQSYKLISKKLRLPAAEILFISDTVRELDAAKEAGMQTLLCRRLGNDPQFPPGDHEIIESFHGVPQIKAST